MPLCATMNKKRSVILDLVTDTSETTKDQLVQFIADLPIERTKLEVVVLSRTSTLQTDILNHQPSKTFVSENNLELLYNAKCYLDDEGITDIFLVTSLMMKKFWETACLYVMANVHSWSVEGLDVSGQLLTLSAPDECSVKDDFKDYLKTVGNPNEVNVYRCSVFPNDLFNAGYHDRHGGVSSLAPMASLNMLYTIRKPDPILVIQENQRRLADAAGFDPGKLHTIRTEHGTKIWMVGQKKPPKYDGLVTNTPGVTVSAPGADCCVILLADLKSGAVGAVHAGWRGTVHGAVRELLKTMVVEYGTDPSNVCASIGPSVSGNHFTLPGDAAKPLTDLDSSLTWPCSKIPGNLSVDLVRSNVVMLVKDGVLEKNIDTEHAYCTFSNERFFSHQRDGIPFGNQIGFISRRISNTK